MDVGRLLFLTMEGDVIRSLLAGNDTQCFTTQQYADAREAWCNKFIWGGKPGTRQQLNLPPPPLETSRKQLLSIGLVEEVKPDIWALKNRGQNES